MKTVAPSACRYFGTNRIQSSSPAPMTKMAMSRMTRLRLSPKKSARDFDAGTSEFCRIGRVIQVAVRTEHSGDFSIAAWAAALARDSSATVNLNEQSAVGLGLAEGTA